MNRVIVYVDDAASAQQVLAPLLARDTAGDTLWVLVACAPRMTHRISKWVSHRARENWRDKWADKLFAQILPLFPSNASGRVTTVLAKGPLAEITDALQAADARPAQVVDARRPRAESPDDTAATHASRRWTALPGTLGSLLSGVGALWVLGLE